MHTMQRKHVHKQHQKHKGKRKVIITGGLDCGKVATTEVTGTEQLISLAVGQFSIETALGTLA